MRRVLGLLLYACYAAAASASTTLLRLDYLEDGKVVSTDIPAKAGAGELASPQVAHRHWRVLPGDALGAAAPSLEVEFFQQADGKRRVVARLRVRYFPEQGRFLPRFRFDEEMFFVRQGNQWRPITLVDGVPSMIGLLDPSLPNAQGYYRSLDFGLTTGPLRIDGWQVKRLSPGPSSPAP